MLRQIQSHYNGLGTDRHRVAVIEGNRAAETPGRAGGPLAVSRREGAFKKARWLTESGRVHQPGSGYSLLFWSELGIDLFGHLPGNGPTRDPRPPGPGTFKVDDNRNILMKVNCFLIFQTSQSVYIVDFVFSLK